MSNVDEMIETPDGKFYAQYNEDGAIKKTATEVYKYWVNNVKDKPIEDKTTEEKLEEKIDILNNAIEKLIDRLNKYEEK